MLVYDKVKLRNRLLPDQLVATATFCQTSWHNRRSRRKAEVAVELAASGTLTSIGD